MIRAPGKTLTTWTVDDTVAASSPAMIDRSTAHCTRLNVNCAFSLCPWLESVGRSSICYKCMSISLCVLEQQNAYYRQIIERSSEVADIFTVRGRDPWWGGVPNVNRAKNFKMEYETHRYLFWPALRTMKVAGFSEPQSGDPYSVTQIGPSQLLVLYVTTSKWTYLELNGYTRIGTRSSYVLEGDLVVTKVSQSPLPNQWVTIQLLT